MDDLRLFLIENNVLIFLINMNKSHVRHLHELGFKLVSSMK